MADEGIRSPAIRHSTFWFRHSLSVSCGLRHSQVPSVSRPQRRTVLTWRGIPSAASGFANVRVMIRILKHTLGFCVAMFVAFLLLQVSLGVARSLFINRDETLLTLAGFWISSAMLWPFVWIPVGVLPDGPLAFVSVYVFWGLLFYAAWLFWRRRPR
jgi:hypothetical protein